MTNQPNNGTSDTARLRAFDPELVFENPFQHAGARRFHGPEFDRFVEDVRAIGVRTPPVARPNPDVSGAVQLREGHRRFAAHKIAFPGQPFTVLVQEISDADMLDDCIRENVFRADWNDIEIAEMMETYARVHPKATNAEIARKFNYKDPASISNIRKLLRLPQGIQTHVAENKIPDAVARQLVGVAAVNPKAAQKIADEVAAAPKSEKQDAFENAMQHNYFGKLVRIGNWSLDWLADAPVETSVDLGDGDHFIGACAGCVFNVGNHCARRVCHDEKQKMFAASEIARVSVKLKIPAVSPDEHVAALFNNHYNDDDRARDLLNARKDIRALLRLAPYEGKSHNYVERILGSAEVTLVTTDKAAIDAYFAERNAPAKATARAVSADSDAGESDTAREQRVAAEKREQAQKRAARSKMWRSYYDARWLLESAARNIGTALAERHGGVFVTFVEQEFCNTYHAMGAANEIETRLENEIKEVSKQADTDALRLAHVALCVIASTSRKDNYRIADNEHEFAFETVRNVVIALCGKGRHTHRTIENVSFGVELPDGWDIPPVHRTEFNCWFCGRFAGNTSEKLTQRDRNEDGWLYYGSDGVFCSQEHADEFARGAQNNARANGKAKKGKGKK